MSCNFTSCILMSCIFMPCNLVRHFHVRHFQRPLSEWPKTGQPAAPTSDDWMRAAPEVLRGSGFEKGLSPSDYWGVTPDTFLKFYVQFGEFWCSCLISDESHLINYFFKIRKSRQKWDKTASRLMSKIFRERHHKNRTVPEKNKTDGHLTKWIRLTDDMTERIFSFATENSVPRVDGNF